MVTGKPFHMVSRLHPKSEDGHIAALKEQFQVPPTQVDVMSNDRHLIYDSNETPSAVGEGQVITLDIPGSSSGSFYDLSQSYILVKGSFTSAAQIDNTINGAIAPVHGWTSRFFNRCDFSMGSVSVVENFSEYGVANYFDSLIHRTKSELNGCAIEEGWITPDYAQNLAHGGLVYNTATTTPQCVPSSTLREHYLLGAAGGARPTVSFKVVPLGPWRTACVPSDVPLRIRLTRAKVAELVFGSNKAAVAMGFTMSSCQAFMTRVVLSPDADRALLQHMDKNPWLIKHNRVRQMTQSFAAGVTELQVRNALQGPMPSKILVWTATETSVTGGADIPFVFQLDSSAQSATNVLGMAPTEIRVRVGDREIPLRGFDVTSGQQSGTAVNLGAANLALNHDTAAMLQAIRDISADPLNAAITDNIYSNVRCYAFDCSLFQQGMLDPIEEGTQIQVTMRLTGSTASRRTLGVISWTPSVIEIHSDRTVTVDT